MVVEPRAVNRRVPGTDLAFSGNTLTGLYLLALDALATGLSIKDNPSLIEIDLARLHHVDGTVVVKGNLELLTFTANRLVVVKGSVKLVGPFTTVEMFRLEEVAGDFEIAGFCRVAEGCKVDGEEVAKGRGATQAWKLWEC